MKLLIFSDIHGDCAALEELLSREADYYLAAGDLLHPKHGFEQVGPLLERRRDRVLVIPGNIETESDIDRFCSRHGFRNLHGKSLEAEGKHIAALGYSNQTPFGTPGEYSEQEIEARLQPFAELSPLVLVCHCPPRNTSLDRAREGAHFGSTAVRGFIEARQPESFFCGHIHEAAGAEDRLGETVGRNVGKRGFLLEW